MRRLINVPRYGLVPLSEATKFPDYIPKLYRKDPEYISRLAEAKARFQAEAAAKGEKMSGTGWTDKHSTPEDLHYYVIPWVQKYNAFRAELDEEIGRRYVEAYVAAKKDWESDRAGATKYQYKHKAPGSDEWVDVDTTPRVLRQAEPALKPEATSRATKVVPQEKMPVQAKAPRRGVMYSDRDKRRLTRRPRRGFRRVRPERWGI